MSDGSVISIHAPLTGSDHAPGLFHSSSRYFNPRSPYGERQKWLKLCLDHALFQSTLPLRGATVYAKQGDTFTRISIHAPLTGSDPNLRRYVQPDDDFNPRSPYGERRKSISKCTLSNNFNPRSPYGERLSGFISSAVWALFQSTLPLRGAT